MRLRHSISITLGVALACMSFGTNVARAAEDIKLQISPVLIEDEANPGETITRMISVTNLSSQILPAQAFATDVYSIDEEGRLGVDGSAGTSSAKDWFRFDQEMILDPGVERQVEVTIVVPKNAQPGGRYVSVFFNPLFDNADGSGSSKVNVQSQIGVLFFLTVKGDVVKRGEISTFDIPFLNAGKTIPMKTSLKNTGNVHLRPHAVIVVRNLIGLTSDEINIEDYGSLSALPGKIRTTTVKWDRAFPIGIYRAEITVSNGPGFRLTKSAWFVVWNVWVILGMMLAAGFSWLYWYTNGKAKRRRKSAKRQLSKQR
ncbi:hypothetical protein BH11PAT4_BH11PAT4_5180 [soil metagenome]